MAKMIGGSYLHCAVCNKRVHMNTAPPPGWLCVRLNLVTSKDGYAVLEYGRCPPHGDTPLLPDAKGRILLICVSNGVVDTPADKRKYPVWSVDDVVRITIRYATGEEAWVAHRAKATPRRDVF